MKCHWVGSSLRQGETQPDSDSRVGSAKGRPGVTAGSHAVEEYTYGIAVGITTYGPSLTQAPPVYTSDRPGFGSTATSFPEGYGRTRQGSAKKGELNWSKNCSCF